MTFANPLGLIGLASLPVILILHLLRERQRRYTISSLILWSFLEAQTRGPRTRRIPLTWLLLLDLLAGALISLAWAQPSLAVDRPAANARHRILIVDVSSSMRAGEGVAGRLGASRLAEAKAAAAALLEGLGPRDAVTLLSFGRTARQIADSRQEDSNALLARIEGLQAGETGHALPEALALGQGSLDWSLPAEFHILTDGAFPLENPGVVEEFAYPLHWHFFGRETGNQAILELNATPLGEASLQVFVRVANFGERAVTRDLVLEIDGEPAARTLVELPADSAVPHVWQVPAGGSPGAQVLSVSLAGQDSLAEDDSAAIGLQPGSDLRIALVAENPAPVQQAIEAAPGAELQVFRPEEHAGGSMDALPPFDLTIFRGYLPRSWPAGQILVLEPPLASENPQETSQSSGEISLYSRSGQEIPSGAVLRFPQPDPLVAGIDFSGVRWSRAWALASPPPGFHASLQAGDVPLLLRGNVRNSAAGFSRFVVLLTDLTRGNFTKHPAFPILMANLVQEARQAPLPPSLKTGEVVRLPEPAGYTALQIIPPDGRAVGLGPEWPSEWEQTLDPGLYHFRFTRSDGGAFEAATGANAGDEIESDLRPRAWTLTPPFGGRQPGRDIPGASPGPEARSIDLRPPLLAALILVLLVEALLAWKR